MPLLLPIPKPKSCRHEIFYKFITLVRDEPRNETNIRSRMGNTPEHKSLNSYILHLLNAELITVSYVSRRRPVFRATPKGLTYIAAFDHLQKLTTYERERWSDEGYSVELLEEPDSRPKEDAHSSA